MKLMMILVEVPDKTTPEDLEGVVAVAMSEQYTEPCGVVEVSEADESALM